MREVYIAASARRALGPEAVARARALSLTGWACAVCEVPLDDREPAAALVTYNATRAVVDYAHPRCSKSTARKVDGDIPNPIDPEVPQDIQISAVIREHDGRPEAALLAEIRTQMLTETAGGEFTDVMVARLLAEGFDLVSDPRQAVDAEQPDWLALILPVGPDRAPVDGNPVLTLLILEGDGVAFFTGTVAVPDAWLDAARRDGRAVLYYGLSGLFDHPYDAAVQLELLDQAASAGRLVATRIPFHRLSPADLQDLEAAHGR